MRLLVVFNGDLMIKTHFSEYYELLRNNGHHIAVINSERHTNYSDIHVLGGERGRLNSLFAQLNNLAAIVQSNRIDTIEFVGMQPILTLSLYARLFLKTNIIFYITGLGYLGIKNNIDKLHIVKPVALFFFRYSVKFIPKHVIVENRNDHSMVTHFNKKIGISSLPGAGFNSRYPFNTYRNPSVGKVRFGYSGRLLYDKGLLELFDAVVLHNESNEAVKWELLVAGDLDPKNPRSLTSDVISKYDAKGINFLGYTDPISDFLEKLDAFVLPSYREGFSKSLIEAACHGIPIVTTDAPGCVDINEFLDSVIICKSRSVHSLRNAMLKMSKSLFTFNKKAKKNISHARSIFDEKKIAYSHLNEIENHV